MTSMPASWLDNPNMVFVGWSLLVILWETAIIGVLLAGWRLWTVRSSAGRQYRAAVLSLVAAALFAVATPPLLVSLRTMSDSNGVTRPAAIPGAPQPVGALSLSGSASAAQAGDPQTMSVSIDQVASAAALVWIAGVVLLACRLCGGLYVARTVVRRAHPVGDGSISAIAARLISELRLRSGVKLLQSSEIEAPVVIGWKSPALILPHDAALRLTQEMLAALLSHELAHVRRRDYLANALQSVVEVLLFFSPPVVWMSRCVREAREFCCDDIAVARCGDAGHYVQALTTLAALGAVNSTRPALGAAGPRLITRVRRLLQGEPMSTSNYARIGALGAICIVLIVTGLRVSVASAARAPIPRAYEASMRRQDSVPFGYASEQEGSGVELQRIVSTSEHPAETATVRNLSTERIVGLRFVAGVERWNRKQVPPRLPIRLFVSDVVPVSIGPGEVVKVSPDVLTAAQLRQLEEESGEARMQLFFGLTAVRYANGYDWSIHPNPAAFSGPEALNIPAAVYARDLIVRDANNASTPFGPCTDDRNRRTSHGGVVPIRNEPGHFMRCDGGRWVETTVARPGASGGAAR